MREIYYPCGSLSQTKCCAATENHREHKSRFGLVRADYSRDGLEEMHDTDLEA